MPRYFVGVDLGQVRDPTAIAVVEATDVLRLRHLERIPLRTKYAQVVERVRQISRAKKLRNDCQVISDATGVGRPVAEMLQAAKLGGKLLPVLVTAGQTETHDGEYCCVPKRDLIVRLATMLQSGQLQFAADLREAPALRKELLGMETRQSDMHERYAAWHNGQHDDLVFALALACWGAKPTQLGCHG
jgi:hypothetical protein